MLHFSTVNIEWDPDVVWVVVTFEYCEHRVGS